MSLSSRSYSRRSVLFSSATAFVALALPWSSKSALAQEGLNPPYFPVTPPTKATDTTKIEVAEVFSYGCIHCFQFQDIVDAWRKRLNTKNVEFVYVPSPYKPVDTMLARGFIAAKSLGIAEQTHHAVFQAIHERGVQIKSLDDVTALYAQLGTPPEKFSKALKDFFVDAEVRRTYDLMIKFKIDSTPTLIVAGKYRITADSAGSQEAMTKVADKLIAQELALLKAKK